MAGVVARMWQAKCYEERGGPGDFGRAIGIYDELMAEPDPRLRPSSARSIISGSS